MAKKTKSSTKNNGLKKVKELEEIIDQGKDKYLRLAAEYENYRKRAIEERLESIENKLPNGELEEMHGMIKEIKEILLDPEDGIIVRVNKNTFWRKEIDADEFKALIRWKQSINSALYVVYTAVVGIILKLIFWT